MNHLKSVFFLTLIFFSSCDRSRVFEKNHVFENDYWIADSVQTFEIEIDDRTKEYSVFVNVRNSSTYPYQNIYLNFYVHDSINNVYMQKLVNNNLFDPRTGKPLGQSGIGDVFDHRFLLLENQKFLHTGKHTVEIEQYMRVDTLQGILGVGVRVEMEQVD